MESAVVPRCEVSADRGTEATFLLVGSLFLAPDSLHLASPKYP
jgi:hypothetical protein